VHVVKRPQAYATELPSASWNRNKIDLSPCGDGALEMSIYSMLIGAERRPSNNVSTERRPGLLGPLFDRHARRAVGARANREPRARDAQSDRRDGVDVRGYGHHVTDRTIEARHEQ